MLIDLTAISIEAELASTGGLLKTPRAALYCGMTAQWLRRLAAQGLGPRIARRDGFGCMGGNYYRPADLDAWMAAGGGYQRGKKKPATTEGRAGEE